MTLAICLCLFAVGRASAQWAVIDPSNIAQSIVNTSKNVVHTSTTAQNMIKNFQETVKIYEQGKKDRKSTRLNSSHIPLSRMPSSA